MMFLTVFIPFIFMIFLSGYAVSSNEFVWCCGVDDPQRPPPPVKDAEYAKKENRFIKVEESTQITTNRNIEFWQKYNVINMTA